MAGDNEIMVRIVADASQLKTETAQAADATKDFGGDVENSSESIEKLNRGMVHLSAHLVSHAAGMGRMGMVMARMGEAAVGVGAVMAVMIPIAALVAGIEVMNKVEEAQLKLAEAMAETAVQESKWNDKVLDSQEKLTALVQGPMAAAVEKAKDFKDKTSELSEVIKTASKHVEENAHWYDNVAVSIQRAATITENFALGRKDTMPMDTTTTKTALADIEARFTKTKDLVAATKELNALVEKVQAAGGPGTEERVAGIQASFGILSAQLKVSANEQKSLDQEVINKKKEEEKKAAEEKARLDKTSAEYAARQAKEAMEEEMKARHERAKEDEEFIKNEEKITAEEVKRIWQAANREIGDEFREQQKNVQRELLGVQAGKGTPVAKETGEAEVYEQASRALGPLIAKTKALKEAETNPEEVAALDEKLVEMGDLQATYAEKVIQLQTRVAESQRLNLDKMTQAFNSNFLQWMNGQERFGNAMIHTWQNVAGAFVQNMLKMGEAELLFLLTGNKTRALEVLGNAKVAASKAMAAVPFPLNIPLAAAAFAGTMAFASFAQGGVMDHDGGAMLHKREMVLPPHIADFVQKAATKSVEGNSGGGDHFHYSPTVQAIDRNGVEDALKEHGDLMFSMWKSQMRDRNMTV